MNIFYTQSVFLTSKYVHLPVNTYAGTPPCTSPQQSTSVKTVNITNFMMASDSDKYAV